MGRRYSENIHHAFPQSLFPDFADEPWNKRAVDRDRHAYWHALVVNASPCRAIIRLLKEFGPTRLKHLRRDPSFQELLHLLKEVASEELDDD